MHRLDLNPHQEALSTTQETVDETTVSHNNQLSSTYTTSSATSPTGAPMNNRSQKAIIISTIIAVLAGVMTGFGGYKLMAKTQPVGPATHPVEGQSIEKGAIFGSQNTDAFKDSAEGYLAIGGLDGEGSHHLLRAGGETQTVYLTSSVTDLDALEGMEVKVWGETFKGQKAGWLMDVGRIEVLNPKGEKPTEE